MNNINNIFSSLRYPIRVSILQLMKDNLDSRQSIPKDSDNIFGFCPEDILMILNESGYDLTYSKLSYHLKEMRENKILSFKTEGKRRFYKINVHEFERLIQWVDEFRNINKV